MLLNNFIIWKIFIFFIFSDEKYLKFLDGNYLYFHIFIFLYFQMKNDERK